MKILSVILATLLLLFFCRPGMAQYEEKNYGRTPEKMVPYSSYSKAYLNFFDEPQAFTGTGREKPEPVGLETVRIGFLGPLEGSPLQPQGMQMLKGSQLAMEEANARGGYKGIPFELMLHNDVGLWGAAANEIVKMDDEKVWAFLGTIDDINSHVALRVALKVELPMMNTGDPDPTLTETRIPWLMRCISDDRQSSYALVQEIYVREGHSKVAVLRANNRYGRVGIMEFRDAAHRLGHPLLLEVRYENGDTVFTNQIEKIRQAGADAIVLWGDAKESAMIVRELRDEGLNQPIFASDRVVNPEFLQIAGDLAEGIVSTCQYNPESKDPRYLEFVENYRKRFGMDPDVFAAHSYDGMNILIDAIQRAGLNRTKIRDLLTDLETYQGYRGVTGTLVLDATWNDVGEIWMARIIDGRFEFEPARILEE